MARTDPLAVALADVLPTGVALVAADGTIQHANAAFSAVFGAAPGSVPAGTTVSELGGRVEFRPAAEMWAGEADRRYRFRLPGERVVQGVWRALGDVRAVIVTDVTGDALVRRRLRQHNRALAELVATKTELVSALLHELRTPLAAARSMSQLLPESGDALTGEAVRAVGRNLDRLDQVIQEIATISGIENGTVDLVARPVDLPGLLAPLGVAVPAHGGTPITGDPERLAEVVTRLAEAVRAVTAEPEPEEQPARLRQRAGQWEVLLPLPSHGAADQLFTTTGAHSNATALMFARAVIGRHGGTVGIESDDGRPHLIIRLPEPGPGAGGSV